MLKASLKVIKNTNQKYWQLKSNYCIKVIHKLIVNKGSNNVKLSSNEFKPKNKTSLSFNPNDVL